MTHVGVTTKCHWWVLLDENWGDDRKSIIKVFHQLIVLHGCSSVVRDWFTV